MAPSAQDAFNSWLLTVGVVGGSACLLVVVVCLVVAAMLMANSRKRE